MTNVDIVSSTSSMNVVVNTMLRETSGIDMPGVFATDKGHLEIRLALQLGK